MNWSLTKIVAFVKAWNRAAADRETALAEVAYKFGMTRESVSVTASKLRRKGFMLARLNYRDGRRSVVNFEARRTLDRLLDELCRRYGVAPDDALSRSRKADGRIDVRKALAWAAHELMGQSWKQITLYFGRYGQPGSHSTAIYWAQTATPEHKRQAQGAFDTIERKEAA